MERRHLLKTIGTATALGFAGTTSAAPENQPVEVVKGSPNRPIKPKHIERATQSLLNRTYHSKTAPDQNQDLGPGRVLPNFQNENDDDVLAFGLAVEPDGRLKYLRATRKDGVTIQQGEQPPSDDDGNATVSTDPETPTERAHAAADRFAAQHANDTTSTDTITTQSTCSGTRNFREIQIDGWGCPFIEGEDLGLAHSEDGEGRYGDKYQEGDYHVWTKVYEDSGDYIGVATNYQQTPGQNYNASSNWGCWNQTIRHGLNDNVDWGSPQEIYTAPDNTSKEGELTGVSASVGPGSFGVGFSWDSPPLKISDQHNDNQAYWQVNINGNYGSQQNRGFASIGDFSDAGSPDPGQKVARSELDIRFTDNILFDRAIGTVRKFDSDIYYEYEE
jgi:hypothetical protein